MEAREMTTEELAQMTHPAQIDPSRIVSGIQLGLTQVFLMRPEPIPQEEQLRRRKRYAQVSWEILDNMREQARDP